MSEENNTTPPAEENNQAEAEQVQAENQQVEAEKPTNELEEVTTLHERTIATLSYVGFFAIVPFYLKKDSKFCRFHGRQGMLITLIFFFAKLLLILDFLMDVALLLQFIIFIYMGFAALSGRWKKFPGIYNMACQLEDSLSLKTKEEEEE